MAFRFCPLRSGSSGNVSFVQAGETCLLVDAGLSARAIEQLLAAMGVSAACLDGILITHEHSDHIKGVGLLSRKYGLPVYANEATWNAMQDKPGIDGIECCNQRIFCTGADFYVRDLGVQSFSIPHDAADPVGYSLYYGGKKLSIATDLGHIQKQWVEEVADADLVLLESNHDPDMLQACRYPAWLKKRILGRRGHLSNADCASVLATLEGRGLRNCVLGHLSQEANQPQLALETVRSALHPDGLHADLAWRDRTGSVYALL
ncbi:MAG TPA: MBL fold metallo-hydrolase [Clostridia bacterium]|nr:MBL fold metallo-hydrolase [Clostridia bacterium]